MCRGEQWEQPDDFVPERFIGIENEPEFFKEKGFIPFGNGPRVCIGQRFGQLEGIILLALIFRKFSASLSIPNQTIQTERHFTQSPVNGLPLSFSLRN